MERTATAIWQGSGKEGQGTISTTSRVLNQSPFTWRTRFQDPEGTSPEELLAAAHAACFSMKLSFVLGNAGFTPRSLQTTCTVRIENGVIDRSHLVLKADIPGISTEVFQQSVEDAKQNCPVSKVLRSEITVEASLV